MRDTRPANVTGDTTSSAFGDNEAEDWSQDRPDGIQWNKLEIVTSLHGGAIHNHK